MTFRNAFLIACGLAIMLAASSAEAAPRISPNNPYRSFNISGINYGSVRWEQTHGRRAGGFTTQRSRGLFFHRR